MLSTIDVKAAGQATQIPVGQAYLNPVTGKREYSPLPNEIKAGFANPTDPSSFYWSGLDIQKPSGEYDVVVLPQSFRQDGLSVSSITYPSSTFKYISNLGKGVVIPSGAVVSSLQDDLNIDYIRFDEGSSLTDYSHAFRGWSNLETVDGFIGAIKPKNGSIDLGETFAGCSSLQGITLDFGGENASFYNTFTECTKLKDITIKNANVSSINQLVVRGNDSYSTQTGINRYPMNITFNGVTFPDNESGSYLSEAFNSVSGKITFKNCTANGSELINFNDAFKGSFAINLKSSLTTSYNKGFSNGDGSYAGGNLEIIGAKAYSAERMFNNATYGVLKLNGLITEDTISAESMFADATVVDIDGINTWQIGTANISDMFNGTNLIYDSESEDDEQVDHLSTDLIEDIKAVDYSKAASADRMLCFNVDGYIPDYSGMDLSGLDIFEPVSVNNAPFYTSEVPPRYYSLPFSNVYYQSEEDKEYCSGYRLTKAAGASGNIEGSLLLTNTLITGSCAKIKVINILSGDVAEYNVISGHKLQEYLDNEIEYFSDSDCNTSAIMTQELINGSSTVLYTHDTGIEDDLDSDVGYEFNVTTGNILATFDGHTDLTRLIDYDPRIRIKKEQKPDEFDITIDSKKKAACQFYDIGITVIEDGVEKEVKTISQDMVVTVPLPQTYDRKGVIILHYADGLDNEPEVLTANVDTEANTVQFYMNSFSHVAVIYNDAAVETREVTVKWVDDGNYRNRCGITFNWTANYEGGLTDTGSFNYTAKPQDETTLSFEVQKEILGAKLESIVIEYVLKGEIGHKPEWDEETGTLTLTLENKEEVENRVVRVDLTDVSDDDFRAYVEKNANITLTVSVTYEDGTTSEQTLTKVLASNYKVYEIPYQLTTVMASGVAMTDIVYSVNMPDSYHAEIDYEADSIVITKEKDVYGDYNNNYTVTGFFNDDNNASGKRPDEVKVKARATFGDKEWSIDFSIVCRRIGYSSYQVTIPVPGTCNGIPRDSITFEPDPVEGYKVTVAKVESDHAWIDYDIEGSGEIEDPVNEKDMEVLITMLGLWSTDKIPNSIVLHLQNTSTGNIIMRTVQRKGILAYNTISFTSIIKVPDDGTYEICGADGFEGNWMVRYSGFELIAEYLGHKDSDPDPNPSGNKYTQNFVIDISDNDNEDGSRPEKVTVTVTDGKGAEEKFEVNVKSGKRFTKTLEVPDETAWSIKSVEGFPDRFKISLSSNIANVEYTPEKATNTVSVKFEGDGDNVDLTRPTSVLVYVKNGESTIKNVTVDSGTNWSANIEVNKYREGVEAKYTIDCDDVKNYSKTVDGNTITLKFSGTLTKAAQDAENAKNSTDGGITGSGSSGSNGVAENDMSLENFDWIDYANRYPDLKRAYGYNKQKLYAHYIRYGIAEGRIATFTGKYSTVNEDILAAYFPDDYKYALIQTSTNGTTTDTVNESTVSGNSVDSSMSENSIDTADPVVDTNVIDNGDGTTTEKMVGEDGTVTEITKDADGNIISTKQYKTGDSREIASHMMIIFGILSLLAGACVLIVSLRDKRPR